MEGESPFDGVMHLRDDESGVSLYRMVIRDRREKKMSFVRIVEEKNPIEMHNKVYEASKNNVLTPEVCMEILSHTNVPVIMGKMLEEIGKLPSEDQSQYKDVILSMFDFRQTSDKVRDKALEIADNLGFENELNDVIERTGDLGYPTKVGCDKIYVIDKSGDYRDVDFSLYENVIVKGEIEDKINFIGNSSLKGVLDLRGTKIVGLKECDLSKVSKIIFEEGAEVSLSGAKNLPTDLDVSMCDEVSLSWCDLRGIKLKFKEGAVVYLNEATNLPKDLDVSMCDYVILTNCNLEGINLKFKDMATVNLGKAKNLSKDLDVSMCDGVIMKDADISNLKELKFKNEKQMKDSQVKIPEDWKGKIIYTDDEKLAPVISRGNEGR